MLYKCCKPLLVVYIVRSAEASLLVDRCCFPKDTMKSELVFAAIIHLACCFSLNARDGREIGNSHNLDENGVFDLVHTMVQVTSTGINATDLYQAAKIVNENACRLAPGVSQEDILKTLLAAASEISLEQVIQAVLDKTKTDADGLTDVVKKIDASLKTLDLLATQAQNSGGDSNSAVLAAICKVADLLIHLMPDLIGHAIEYVNENYKRDLTQDTHLFVSRSATEGSQLAKRGWIHAEVFGMTVDIHW